MIIYLAASLHSRSFSWMLVLQHAGRHSSHTQWHISIKLHGAKPKQLSLKTFWWTLSSRVRIQIKFPLNKVSTSPRSSWQMPKFLKPTVVKYFIYVGPQIPRQKKIVFSHELQTKVQVKEQTAQNWVKQRFPSKTSGNWTRVVFSWNVRSENHLSVVQMAWFFFLILIALVLFILM